MLNSAITQKVTGDRNIFTATGAIYIYNPPPPLPSVEVKEWRELSILQRKVRQFWIEGVLEKSIHTTVLLDLGKETQVEAVEHPWERVLELPDQTRHSLPLDQKISDIFDKVDRALLILGQPGSGKTTTLLELARDLIIHAEQAEAFNQPIPVIFNLSTWSNKRQPLIDWLVAELAAKYQIPNRIGRLWLENNRLLPLLDGLDEVKSEYQADCVVAINHFGEAFGLAGLAVCSRLEEYLNLPVRLKLNGAICLQPLTLEQVDTYLAMAGSKLVTLRTVLQDDPVLQELAQSPLMLSVMSLAYQDVSMEELATERLATLETRRQHLFDTYISRMFKRRKTALDYTPQQTIRYLSWLAQKMTQDHQAIFLIEQLQPGWLATRLGCWAYALGSRLIAGLSLGLTIGLTIGLIEGVIIGLIEGLCVGLIDMWRFARPDKFISLKKRHPRWYSAINVLLVGLITGLIYGLISSNLLIGLTIGLIFGLIFGLRGSRQSLTDDIQTVEALNWIWPGALKGTAFGLTIALSLGLIIGLRNGLNWQNAGLSAGLWIGLKDGLHLALRMGLILGPIGAMFGGLKSSIVETKTLPNQGIRLSVRNIILAGLILGPLMGLGIGLTNSLSAGLSFGLTAGLSAALWYGGFDLIQHYTLRLILSLQGYIPRNYPHFLNYAAGYIFLQRIGGGYGFIHRLLLEHFAAMAKRPENY